MGSPHPLSRAYTPSGVGPPTIAASSRISSTRASASSSSSTSAAGRGALDVRRAARADDRDVHRGVRQRPRDRELRDRDLQLPRELLQALDDREVALEALAAEEVAASAPVVLARSASRA